MKDLDSFKGRDIDIKQKENELQQVKYRKSFLIFKKKYVENIKEKIQRETMILTRCNRCLVFTILVILNILVNMDHGTIPAATEEISHYLGIDKSTIGLYGSLAFFGSLLGSFMSMPLMNYGQRKLILLVSLTINFISTYLLAVREKYLGAILRVLVGISQSFLSIYSPVWVDQFGNKKSKTLMMAFQQISGPLGIVSGYILTFLIKKQWMWYWGLIIQAIAITICVLILLFIDKKYFSYDFFSLNQEKLLQLSRENQNSDNKEQKSFEISNAANNPSNIGNNFNKNISSNVNIGSRVLTNNDDKNNLKNNQYKNLNGNLNHLECNEDSKNTTNLTNNKFLISQNVHEDHIESLNKNYKCPDPVENNKEHNHNIINVNINIENNNTHKNNYGSMNNNEIYCIDEENSRNKELKNLYKHGKEINDANKLNINVNNNNISPKNNDEENIPQQQLEKALVERPKEEDEISIFYKKTEMVKQSASEKFKEFFRNVKLLFKEKVYVFAVIAVAILNFISTAIQYWVSDHLKKVMKFDEDQIFICFVITCVTAPTLGVISGGYIVQKFGGYESKKSIVFCFVFGIIAGLDAILILFQENIIGFSIVLWIFLFFGGAIVPNMIGIFISSLPNELRAFGNSFSTTMITLFGQLPAPYVYGAIYSIDERKKTAFNLTMLYSWAGVIFIFITMIIRLRKFKKLENADLLRDSKRPQAGEIRRRSDIMLEFSQQINNDNEQIDNINNKINRNIKPIPLDNSNNNALNPADDTTFNATAVAGKEISKLCENDTSINNVLENKNLKFNKYKQENLIDEYDEDEYLEKQKKQQQKHFNSTHNKSNNQKKNINNSHKKDFLKNNTTFQINTNLNFVHQQEELDNPINNQDIQLNNENKNKNQKYNSTNDIVKISIHNDQIAKNQIDQK